MFCIWPDDGSVYITQILIFTTARFEWISQLIKVTYNNDAQWKLEISYRIILNNLS
jgi:hypothetical protein